ncbi:MAG: hypothetical protein AAGG46_11090 [Planctomycetota bacterium]
MLFRTALAAVVMLGGTLVVAPDADAAGRWWRARSTRTATNTYSNFKRSLEPSRRVVYSGISRGEQDRQRRRDAWYDHAFNGWRPEDFH